MAKVQSLLDFDVPERFNQASFLVDRHLAEGRGSNAAFYFRDEVITYAALAAACNRAGNALRSLGVGADDRVAMVLTDRPELPFTYLGAMKAGAIPLPLNPLQTADEIAYCLQDSGARVAVVDEQFLPKVVEARREARSLEHVVVVSDSGAVHPGTLAYDELTAAQSAVLEAAPTAKDGMAFWMYSSGTTGKTKAVVHRHRDVLFYQPPFAEPVLEAIAR